MPKLEIKLPDVLRSERYRLERDIHELVIFETKRRMLLEFVDEVMKGAKQLSDEKLVKLGRKFKKGRYEQLKKRGLV